MDGFAKYLKQISDEMAVLDGDISKIIMAKKKAISEDKKIKKEDPEKKDASNFKQAAKEQFKAVSLKSLHPVTKMYKSKGEIKNAQENPEIDFVTHKIKDIFKNF